MSFYGLDSYGLGFFGEPFASVPKITNAYSYIADSLDRRIFYWFMPDVSGIDTYIDLNYDLEISTDPSGMDVSAIYDIYTAESFFNGNIIKGFQIPFINFESPTHTRYWRVRAKCGALGTGPWSDIMSFDTILKEDISIASSLMGSLPDENIYDLDSTASNIYKIQYTYAKELDFSKALTTLFTKGMFIEDSLDEMINQGYRSLTDFTKYYGIQQVEYRQILQNLILAYLEGSTIDALKKTSVALTAYEPIIDPLRTKIGWQLFEDSKWDYDGSAFIDTDPSADHYYIPGFTPSTRSLPHIAINSKNAKKVVNYFKIRGLDFRLSETFYYKTGTEKLSYSRNNYNFPIRVYNDTTTFVHGVDYIVDWYNGYIYWDYNTFSGANRPVVNSKYYVVYSTFLYEMIKALVDKLKPAHIIIYYRFYFKDGTLYSRDIALSEINAY